MGTLFLIIKTPNSGEKGYNESERKRARRGISQREEKRERELVEGRVENVTWQVGLLLTE